VGAAGGGLRIRCRQPARGAAECVAAAAGGAGKLDGRVRRRELRGRAVRAGHAAAPARRRAWRAPPAWPEPTLPAPLERARAAWHVPPRAVLAYGHMTICYWERRGRRRRPAVSACAVTSAAPVSSARTTARWQRAGLACRRVRGPVRGGPLRVRRVPPSAGRGVPAAALRRVRARLCLGRRGGQLRRAQGYGAPGAPARRCAQAAL